MIIRTKRYKLLPGTYIRLGLQNIVREQWWVSLIAFSIMSGTFFFKTPWFIVVGITFLGLYGLFWIIQFYGITQLEQNHLIFERLFYEITNQKIIAYISSKQGMPITWDQIKRVKQGKDYFVLIISKTHITHFPYKIFNSPYDIKLVETILRRKGLLK